MAELKDVDDAAKLLLENTTAIKGADFVRAARVALLMRNITRAGVHACECNDPACNLTTVIGIHATFSAAMVVLVGHMTEQDQRELANLLDNLDHLHQQARKAIHGEQP